MPVAEVEVRLGSSVGSEHRYGCFNRPPYLETVEHSQGGASWPFRMSRECRYDRSLSDRFCQGCKHAGSGEAWIESNLKAGAK